MNSKIFAGLNKEQKDAVQHTAGPLLIVAGAGTGKTTVVTRRIANLIEQGINPESILAVAFAQKAAEEMVDRVDQLLPFGYYDLRISTFHSFCEKFLREYGLEIGLPDFKVLDEPGQWMLVRNNLEKFDLDYYRPLGNPTKFIRSLVSHFNRAKDELVSPDDYLEFVENFKLGKDNGESGIGEKTRLDELANAYQVYQKTLLKDGFLDFGDLVFYTNLLLTKRPAVLERLRKQFRYILVDEFQDTNYSQYEILKLLASPKNNLTVVGDDDQSIFKFRGASISNILHFRTDYPNARFISLTQNYRNGQKILDHAYRFINQNNPERLEIKLKIDKRLKSNIGIPGKIEIINSQDYVEEAREVAAKIIDIESGEKETGWNDFAVLARSHDTLEAFIKIFSKLGIPHIYFANKGLYRKPIISDIFSYFRLLDNYHESAAVYRVLNFRKFRINPDALIEINHYARKKSLSLFESLKHSAVLKRIGQGDLKKIQQLLSLIEKHTKMAQKKNVSELFVHIWQDLEMKDQLGEDPAQLAQNSNFVESFGKKIRDFENQSDDRTLRAFMEQVGFEMDAGEQGSIDFDPEAGPEAVKLLTVHGAKGLEYKYVFIVGLVDKRFPAIDRKDPIELPDKLIKDILPGGDVHLQEERRLFYVGMTRAKSGLFLTRAFDYGGKMTKKPSRFLIELGMVGEEKQKPTGKVQLVSRTAIKPKLPVPKQFSFSHISTFRSCPLEYKYRFVLGLPVAGSAYLSFGQTIHNTFEKFSKIYHQNSRATDLFGAGEGVASLPDFVKLEKIYTESWIDDWYDSKEDMDRFRIEGRKMLKDFYADFKADPPKFEFIEEWFRMKVADSIFVGKIDRADKTDKGLIIIDYKTGQTRTLAKVEKEQLLIYQWAAQEYFKKKVVDLQYWYLKDRLTKVSFLGNEKDIVELKQGLRETIDEIIYATKNDLFAEIDSRKSHRSGECEYKILEDQNETDN